MGDISTVGGLIGLGADAHLEAGNLNASGSGARSGGWIHVSFGDYNSTLPTHEDLVVGAAGGAGTSSILSAFAEAGSAGGKGGTVEISAASGINSMAVFSDKVSVKTNAGDGGSISLSSPAAFSITAGKLDAAGKGAGSSGGSVNISGDIIVTGGNLLLDASGDKSGGTVSIAGNNSALAIGPGSGQISLDISGGNVSGTGDAGILYVSNNYSTGVGIYIDALGLKINPGAKSGNGALLLLRLFRWQLDC